MRTAKDHPWGRPAFLNTYFGYAVGCAITWAIILSIVGRTASDDAKRNWHVYFGGWVAGWSSATIARVVYPPPKRPRVERTSATKRERAGDALSR